MCNKKESKQNKRKQKEPIQSDLKHKIVTALNKTSKITLNFFLGLGITSSFSDSLCNQNKPERKTIKKHGKKAQEKSHVKQKTTSHNMFFFNTKFNQSYAYGITCQLPTSSSSHNLQLKSSRQLVNETFY